MATNKQKIRLKKRVVMRTELHTGEFVYYANAQDFISIINNLREAAETEEERDILRVIKTKPNSIPTTIIFEKKRNRNTGKVMETAKEKII